MKSIIPIFILFAFNAEASDSFINTHQHLIFNHIQETEDPNWVNAGILVNNRVPGHSTQYIIVETKPKVYERIPLAQHEFEKNIALSVFEATTGTGTSRGTAFLVGQDLVLTNMHILANKTKCLKFSIDLNHRSETVACKQVEYCDPVEDFCLVRMNSLASGKSIGEEVNPLTFTTETPIPEAIAFVIGNAYGVGIQSASHSGTKTHRSTIAHCVRVFSGNSGSPVIGESGNVLGIHHARGFMNGLECPKDRKMGLAVTSSKILKAIKDAKPEVYKELGFYRSSHTF
ncbi:MAG: trypsin-like peptidase domain-containing protein [Xanthomonadaceae bacterium]|nr:trypsin-like peptidase domain-containing protein [Xanthomonadaceae bacterium]